MSSSKIIIGSYCRSCKFAALAMVSALLMTLSSCHADSTTRPGQTSPFASEAVARARADAKKVIDAPEKSMLREKALLGIHARYHRIVLAGDSATAQIYYEAAMATLDSAAVFASDSVMCR